jgi:hypothetical protein
MQKQFMLPDDVGVLRLPVGKVVLATVGGKTVLVEAVADDAGDQTDPTGSPSAADPAKVEAKATVIQPKDQDWTPVLTPPDWGWTTAIVRGDTGTVVLEHTGYVQHITTASQFSIEGDASTWKPELVNIELEG